MNTLLRYQQRKDHALPQNETKMRDINNGLGRDLPETEEQLFELAQYPLLDDVKGLETLGGDD